MKIQIEHLDLLAPWPSIRLREGYYAVSVFVRLGAAPIGAVLCRPARGRVVSHERLQRRMARQLGPALLDALVREGVAAGAGAMRDVAGIEKELLLPRGLPPSVQEWVARSQARRNWPMPAVTVAVCTRDCAEALEAGVRRLQRLDYPNFEILIVDSSHDPVPTREVAERMGVDYARSGRPGVAHARNLALEHARCDWVAFIDDDATPEAAWLSELVGPAQEATCRAVRGTVVPARLDSAAEIAFEMFRGMERTQGGPLKGAACLHVGAGRNLLVHRKFVQRVGGFDVHLPCAAEAELFERIARRGCAVAEAPRAIVHAANPSPSKAVRRLVRDHAAVRSVLLARRVLRLDLRALLQLTGALPVSLMRDLWDGARGKSRYPWSLALAEVRGTIAGPFGYLRSRLRRRRPLHIVRPPAQGGRAPRPHPAGVVRDARPARAA